MIRLTFDDGPHSALTPMILDTLRAARARVTFFVVGDQLKKRGALSIVSHAIADGHTIGNHSLTHCDLTRRSDIEIALELSETTRLLRPLGIESTIFRPPYGRINKTVLGVIQRLGYQLALWDNDPRDWAPSSQPVKWITAAITDIHRRGATTIVCHDTKQSTAKHLSRLLTRLAQEGYSFASWEEGGKQILDRRESQHQQYSPTSSTLGPA
jgi:peptidoglycan/xylan/chitin deacetylase (PgdA/CDA1 family)